MANKVLKEYLLQGYVISKERSLVTNENYVRLINKVKSLDERYTFVIVAFSKSKSTSLILPIS